MAKQNKSSKEPKLPKRLLDSLSGLISTSAPKDFDPEGGLFKDGADQDNDSGNESIDSDAGREHYLEVGMSKLRNELDLPVDDPKYKGKRKSRAEIFNDESSEENISEEEGEEEEEEVDLDDIDDSEEVDDSEADESISNMNEDIDLEDAELDEGSIEEQASEEEDSEDDSQLDDDSENDDYSDGLGDGMQGFGGFDVELDKELQEAEQEEKELLSSLAKKSVDDATKGKHVKHQLSIWENSLDLRIRFQKILQQANQLPQDGGAIKEAYEAENPGINDTQKQAIEIMKIIDELMNIRKDLWPRNSNDLKAPIIPSVPLKRSYEDATVEEIWNDLMELNNNYLPYRKTTIEKWNTKVKASDGTLAYSKKFKAIDQSILTQINGALADSQRLLKRCHLKRSTYNVIGKEKENDREEDLSDNHDEEIYDDGDFYQQLLKEFLDSRMIDNDTQPLATGLRWAASQNKLSKGKIVDTKASKGRKLKYTVHDKLVSFMVPIPTQTWHQEMVDELYSSLFRKNDVKDKAQNEEIVNDGLRIFG